MTPGSRHHACCLSHHLSSHLRSFCPGSKGSQTLVPYITYSGAVEVQSQMWDWGGLLLVESPTPRSTDGTGQLDLGEEALPYLSMSGLGEGNSTGADAAVADGTRSAVTVIVVEVWDHI